MGRWRVVLHPDCGKSTYEFRPLEPECSGAVGGLMFTSEQIHRLSFLDSQTLGTFLGLAEMVEEGHMSGERAKARLVEILVEYRLNQRNVGRNL